MGSRGTNKFDDYTVDRQGPGGSDRPSTDGPCDKAITAVLEEVERCSYFQQYQSLPLIGTPIKLKFEKRLGVATGAGELIGYLPTEFNYLAGCISTGRSYEGSVVSTANTPVAMIRVDLAPA